MSTLLLVRHAQASYLEADYDKLSPLGEQQARRMGEHWGERGPTPDAVYTGPRRRQIHTAEIVAETLRARGKPWPELVVLDELDEYRNDELLAVLLPRLIASDAEVSQLVRDLEHATERRERGRALDRVLQAVMRAWVRDEGGDSRMESWRAFNQRLERARQRLTASDARGRHVVAFSSGGSIGAIVGQLLGATGDGALELGWTLNNTGVVEILFSSARCNLSRYNLLEHLADPSQHTYR